jgi:HEPN domain-containing protein
LDKYQKDDNMKPETQNWLESADYDLESARYMFSTGRYLYVVFLCHLTLEKTLKALVSDTTTKPAPRSHDLILLLKRSSITPELRHLEFIGKLNNASIPTRYPVDIQQAIKDYPAEITKNYLKQTEEIVKWLKADPRLKK